MKKNLLLVSFAVLACVVYAGEPVIKLDSIKTKDPYGDLYKTERYTYDGNLNILKYIKWDNTGDALKQDSTFYKYDSRGNMTYKEKWSYPRTSKYPGWKGSSKNETSYYPNDSVYMEKSWSYFQPNADLEGEWYASTGYTYTYYDDGKVLTKLLSTGSFSGGAPVPYTDKLMYVYTYDDQGRVILESGFKKDPLSGEWNKTDFRKMLEYSSPLIKTAAKEQYENYIDRAWIPSSKIERRFDEWGNTNNEEYWSYDQATKEWKGTSKSEWNYLSKKDILYSREYKWDATKNDWKPYRKTDNTYTDNLKTLSITQEFDVSDFINDSKTEYGYDDMDRQNMSAYYTWKAPKGSSTKMWIGTSKSEKIFNGNDKEIEVLSSIWDTYDNKWTYSKKMLTDYNENNDISYQDEYAFDGFEFNNKYMHTYYYTAYQLDGLQNIETKDNFKISVLNGSIRVELTRDLPVSFYKLDGSLIKANSKSCDSLSTGVYIVKIGSEAVKVMVY